MPCTEKAPHRFYVIPVKKARPEFEPKETSTDPHEGPCPGMKGLYSLKLSGIYVSRLDGRQLQTEGDQREWLLSAHIGLYWTKEGTKTLLGQLSIIGALCTSGPATFHWIWNYFKMNYYSTMSVYFLMPQGVSGFQTENTIVSFQLRLCTCLKGVATGLNAPEVLSSGDSRYHEIIRQIAEYESEHFHFCLGGINGCRNCPPSISN